MKKSKFKSIIKEAVREELKETLKPMLVDIIDAMISQEENKIKKEGSQYNQNRSNNNKFIQEYKNQNSGDKNDIRNKVRNSVKTPDFNNVISGKNKYSDIINQTANEMKEKNESVDNFGSGGEKSILDSGVRLPESVTKHFNRERNKELIKKIDG